MYTFCLRAVFTITCLTLSIVLATVSNAQENTELPTATARSGDGIHTLLLRHGLDPATHTSEFLELNRDALGSNQYLYAGRSYKLPETNSAPSANTLEYPIFGEKYSTVAIRDKKLDGAVYYLVAGHGGPDPGAIARYGGRTISEHEYAYDVTLRLARRLLEHSATVYIIIQSDHGIRDESILSMSNNQVTYPGNPIPHNQLLRLKQRTDIVNNLYNQYRSTNDYQRMVSIHIDSRSQGQNIDVFFYHHRNSSAGQKLAANIHQTFREKYARHQPSRLYDGTVTPRSNLYVIRNTYPPVVFIELGNLRNVRDQPRFILSSNRQALANWIADGIIRDFENR